MRNAERDTLHSELLRDFCRLTRDCQGGTPARLPHHFKIHPFHPAPQACPQRIDRRLFCRKPPRVPFVLVLEPFAVFALPRRVHPLQKHFTIALNRPLDPLHLGNVHPRPHDHAVLSDSCMYWVSTQSVLAFVVAGLFYPPTHPAPHFASSPHRDYNLIGFPLPNTSTKTKKGP